MVNLVESGEAHVSLWAAFRINQVLSTNISCNAASRIICSPWSLVIIGADVLPEYRLRPYLVDKISEYGCHTLGRLRSIASWDRFFLQLCSLLCRAWTVITLILRNLPRKCKVHSGSIIFSQLISVGLIFRLTRKPIPSTLLLDGFIIYYLGAPLQESGSCPAHSYIAVTSAAYRGRISASWWAIFGIYRERTFHDKIRIWFVRHRCRVRRCKIRSVRRSFHDSVTSVFRIGQPRGLIASFHWEGTPAVTT